MGPPPILGFAVRLSANPVAGTDAVPPWSTAGRAVPVHAESRGAGQPHWSGWVLTGASGGPVLACQDGVRVLLAGELYHRPALRDALGETDGETSDAELLLACWLRYGRSGLRLCNGRFAAVVTEGQAVVAATDHAGTVPLYLRCGPGGVEIATEAKTLAHRSGGRAPLSLAVSGTESAPGFGDVRRVRAGTAVTLTPGSTAATSMRTWLPPQHRVIVTPDDAVRRVADTLGEAVRTRLGTPGGAVTAVLSGGIDSSSVVALASGSNRAVETVSLGTDAGDEFAAARTVAEHVGTEHHEFHHDSANLVRQLPWAVAAAEITDAEVLEYLLPLVVLYRQLPGDSRRVVTGYGADIPLGGMHRATERLHSLDAVIADDMDTFDGLNELSPVLGGLAGHWTTHPFWDRDVLELLTSLEPGLKRRDGRDKWVLREAVRELLPVATVTRPKLGIHEGSGASGMWSTLLRDAGVAPDEIPAVKDAMSVEIHRRVVGEQEPPDDVYFDTVLHGVLAGRTSAVVGR